MTSKRNTLTPFSNLLLSKFFLKPCARVGLLRAYLAAKGKARISTDGATGRGQSFEGFPKPCARVGLSTTYLAAKGQARISTDGATGQRQSFEGTNFVDQSPLKLSDRTLV